MNSKILKGVSVGVAMFGALSPGMANAFVLNGGFNLGLGAGAAATDVYRIVCPSTAGVVATDTASLWGEVTDMANVILPPFFNMTIFKNGNATNASDPVDAVQMVGGVPVSLPGPRVTLAQGNGTYHIIVSHTGAGAEGYAVSAECQNAFGVPLTANSVTQTQDQ